MSYPTNTTAKQIWNKLADKEYRDSFVASNISNTVSSQIFTMRDQRGWKQKDLAQRAGMSQSRIPPLEDPDLENFEIGTLKKIASVFDVALVVRFVPFSELARWTSDLSEEKLSVPEFASDQLSPAPASYPSVVIVEMKTSKLQPHNALIQGSYGYGTNAGTNAGTSASSTENPAYGIIPVGTVSWQPKLQQPNFGPSNVETKIVVRNRAHV